VKLRVRLFASFREAVGTTKLDWEAPGGSTVADVLADIRARYPALGPAADKAMVAVNQEYVTASLVLNDGDEIALIPPVSGG
jgi:molybdopterin converting factor subunit 1